MRWRRFKSPFCRARAMWRDLPRLQQLDPADFQREFDRIYAKSNDIKTLCQLGGAADFYLQANPNAISIPVELPRRLVRAHHVHARIVGLRLLNQLEVPDAELVAAIVQAMREPDTYGEYSGTFVLCQFLNRRRVADLDPPLVRDLCGALSLVLSRHRDGPDAAAALLHFLKTQ